jgi:hypothetical protein
MFRLLLLLVLAIIAIFFGSIAVLLGWSQNIKAGRMALLVLDDSFNPSSSTTFAGTSSSLDDVWSA